ncbi:hypothetical protein CLAFUW4_04603 [Fulvia fulva]|uniref:DUF1479-domain-containing protein n=1 Tax=Passalora fulva TaxID=5499 RepID=A0A9Q8LEJ2_PASFU|nr:uncharacterized protein CLAFUR5_04564 [Fulvia fulva]KAK4626527.1 hypothetical protein CLAFUR4_04589 [Fulvia fulva]KAK4628513.1 hypothetical protein CLAFUR0_04591 [Fulvia fulva]UJO16071.1 hypothetical protein CLAFUR5_04564 [Fulvia fulva]WPV14405.1 hypothetical protein CLAFUW4_04603 [Fulvia fulva]WPV28212.1 hypothetical protein CLAFUW7_04595 [Fulvia fulva]
MATVLRPSLRAGRRVLQTPSKQQQQARNAANASAQKRQGDISDAFASLSGIQFTELDPRFADLKAQLIAGKEDALYDSWNRLLASLREEIPLIAQRGPDIVPQIDFKDIDNAGEEFKAEHRKRGVAVIRNVVPEQEALNMKTELRAYLEANPHTKAFPADNPQVYELYWSPSQINARSHPNLIKAQRFLMEFWHSKDPSALISSSHPMIYADRLRMRMPGDAQFALGPHVDGGSCERWEPDGYGKGKVYESICNGQWESYDPWESSCRLPVVSDLYNGVGACSMFRMFQGWLSLSNTGPFEGTLLVNPLLSRATAYFLLRPFFSPKQPAQDPTAETYEEAFLAPQNWEIQRSPDAWLQGATPGHGQELRPQLHPHLNLPSSMVHVPRVNPGDYVSWHCDTIHAVDSVHAGKGDSSVMYIPACPLTVSNAEFVARQRQAFLEGTPSPDFGGGKGESEHLGRPGVQDVEKVNPVEGMRAFGLKEWDNSEPDLTEGQKKVMDRANKVLGFYA